MSDQIHLEIRAANTVDAKKLADTFSDELRKQSDNVAIEAADEIPTLGMTTPDIVISIVISLASSAAVHVYRDEIDRAAKSTGEILKTYVRALFKNKPKSIDEEE